MRIISGKFKGKRIIAPKSIKARPTTDFAKESLFNILEHKFDFQGADVLDLFAGTGNISYELISRGAAHVTAVDVSLASYKFINTFAHENEMNIKCIKADVFKFLKRQQNSYPLIFADPPYALKEISQLPNLIFDHNWLSSEGLLIIEHSQETSFKDHPRLIDHRKYSRVNFSFFE
ncbi:16S rRNA (guanine(966)-N(2))-methyltransferase RsmD [Parvicella tangerina]|uniref:Ribosomal RNA small subunit methyltransferase D n=1 Tax=Parvicella tangerina TaxID=2829795 RepID=A0A916JQH7_9FLAO|nr:16S rRNA (guanine(966)-N(2))-methyltransferase RsmD [Parvicella tangerina]CAG5086264.1 Ribosomal RNA small subunit methyltransferase D [Parvicella tangerina]